MRAVVFVIGACAISWGLYYGLKPFLPATAMPVLLIGFMFGPLVSALATGALLPGPTVKEALALRFGFNLWWLAAWFAPLILTAAAFGVAVYGFGYESQGFAESAAAMAEASGRTLSPEEIANIPPLPVILLIAMIAGVIPNAIAAFGEEAGWRGFLWTELRPSGFWKATLAVGLVWGLWHAPIIIDGFNYGKGYAGFPWLGVAAMSGFCILLSPFMGFLRDRTGSVFPAAIFHGVVNAVAGVFVLMIKDIDLLIASFSGLAGMTVLAAEVFVVVLLRPNRAPR